MGPFSALRLLDGDPAGAHPDAGSVQTCGMGWQGRAAATLLGAAA